MAFDGFIKFKTIDGESLDSKHQGWIEISDCNMEILQTVTKTASSVGGASAERADFSDFRFTKLMDKASPALSLACADGTHFDTVIIELCRAAGSEKLTFMKIELLDCLISSIAMSAAGDFPSEIIQLDYGKIQWTYIQQDRQGGMPKGQSAASWNRRQNCPA
jgi:type VI secretion system secreted protein Hcp